jgi:hypothetical protein
VGIVGNRSCGGGLPLVRRLRALLLGPPVRPGKEKQSEDDNDTAEEQWQQVVFHGPLLGRGTHWSGMLAL